MSKTYKHSPAGKDRRRPASGRGRQRNISVRAVRRDPPDLRKLSRALIQLALAEADAAASAAASAAAQPATPADTGTSRHNDDQPAATEPADD